MRRSRGFVIAIVMIMLYLGYCRHVTQAYAMEAGQPFELPLSGAGGYVAADTSTEAGFIKAGTPIRIVEDKGGYVCVATKDGEEFDLTRNRVLVNLPDLIPSIVYKNTNGDASVFRSSGEALDRVTGEQLYQSWYFNPRLHRYEYVMPVMLDMASKIMEAQTAALEDGYTLVIYEAYRPYETQMLVRDELTALANRNLEVREGIDRGGWGQSWFIAQSLSNHQRACAMDVSLASVEELRTVKDITFVSDYTELEMPTEMHELSTAAVTFKYGVASNNAYAWRNVPLAETMTDGAIRLQEYCTEAELYPLASEWWHFNDLDAKAVSICNGNFYLEPSIRR